MLQTTTMKEEDRPAFARAPALLAMCHPRHLLYMLVQERREAGRHQESHNNQVIRMLKSLGSFRRLKPPKCTPKLLSSCMKARWKPGQVFIHKH